MTSERKIMEPKSESPLNLWRLNHRELYNTKAWNQVDMLSGVLFAADQAYDISEVWEAHVSDISRPLPDIVAYAAHYGEARLLIYGWKEFPIEVRADEVDAWKEWMLGTTLREFREINISSIAGGFMELAAVHPRFTADTIQQQLQQKYARLAELANKPLEWYTPTMSFTQSELDDSEESYEWDRIDEVFALYEQLTCFYHGFPILRGFALTEQEPEFGLPSKKLYDALLEVDLNFLRGQLYDNEDALKNILRFLLTCDPYYSRSIVTAPASFWWRHWPGSKRAASLSV